MFGNSFVNIDEELLLLQAKIVSFYANNNELKLYKNRFQLMLEITNDYLDVKGINVSDILDLCVELDLIDYRFNDFGGYYYPKVVLAIEDYEPKLLDVLHKYNIKFNNKVYKEIKDLADKSDYFSTLEYEELW